MDSLQLIGELEEKGVLTKQAGHRLRLQRTTLIRNELVKEAGKLGRLLGDAKELLFHGGTRAKERVVDMANHRLGPAAYRLGKAEREEGGALGMGTAGLNIMKLMALAGMASAASAGINAGIRHGRDKRLNSEIESSYGQLGAENPDLAKRMSDADPAKAQAARDSARKHFEVLARFAPSLAANPTVAASILGETIMRGPGGMDANRVKLMTDIQRSIDAIHKDRSAWGGDSPIAKHMPFVANAIGG